MRSSNYSSFAIRSQPPRGKYSAKAWQEYLQTPLQHDERDEVQLRDLHQRSANHWNQEDAALFEETTDRNEERKEIKLAPLRRELEGYFDRLNLPPLPPPLAKSSEWLQIRLPCYHANENLRPFLIACEEGLLNKVKEWVQDKKEWLQQIGLKDGLACAAKRNQIDIVRYLLEEGGASLHGAVVEAACHNRSLPLFELSMQHGYHPNQQIPSYNGCFGTALIHCLDNEDITRFLLQNGADPNLAPFRDNRTWPWGYRATPPMNRTSGLVLDRAVKQGSSVVIQMLLEHGANPRYARPLHGVVCLCNDHRAAHPDTEDDWRPLMKMLLRYGADVNASTYGAGTPLVHAVRCELWDIVEFLLERGADPRRVHPVSGLDAFAAAARGMGIPWEETESVKKYLSYLCDLDSKLDAGNASPVPDSIQQNPLVCIIKRIHGEKAEEN